ncbi:hypothetical protein M1293_00780, partial [Candidatus Parvarchaeota archaeon]|nr:hypothetical protein [Candidatus Parvarchaeota archaeon]
QFITYGLIVMDHREATFGILSGSKITSLKHIKSFVPGKMSKGGQSAMRFSREREGLIRDFYKEIAETAKDLFFEKKIVGLVIGGPGPAKDNFIDSGYLVAELSRKIKGVKSISYTDESGLQELVEKSSDIFANERITIERGYIQRMMGSIARNDNMAAYGEAEVIKELQDNNVELILVSSGLDEKKKNEFYYMAKEKKVNVEFISMDSSDGLQLYNLGGVGAFLKRPSKRS